MEIKTYRPYTPSTRAKSTLNFSDLTARRPQKSLLTASQKACGRNNQGRITARHKGGGHKQLYRKIDFKRNKHNVEGVIVSIEYDPNRSANIALVCYADGEKRYIIHPEGLNIGDNIISAEFASCKLGNTLPLGNIAAGTHVHNIELIPGKGGQLVRAAGSFAKILAKDGDFVILRLSSKEIRLFKKECCASIGVVSNSARNNIVLGKAGRKRWLGVRPTVRGSAMNPVDHPHGGGEGKSPIGRPRPLTPWGKPALGFKTRKRTKTSNALIVRSRK